MRIPRAAGLNERMLGKPRAGQPPWKVVSVHLARMQQSQRNEDARSHKNVRVDVVEALSVTGGNSPNAFPRASGEADRGPPSTPRDTAQAGSGSAHPPDESPRRDAAREGPGSRMAWMRHPQRRTDQDGDRSCAARRDAGAQCAQKARTGGSLGGDGTALYLVEG